MHEADYLGSVKMVLQDLNCINSRGFVFISFSFSFLFLKELQASEALVKFSEYWKEGKLNSSLNSFCWPQIPSIATAHRGCRLYYVVLGAGTHPQLRTYDVPTSNFLEGSFALTSRFTRDLQPVLPEEYTG